RAAQELGLPPDARVVIQGFGNAGSHLARMLAADGFRIVGLSDSAGGVAHPGGLDVVAVAAAKRRHGSVTAYAAADPVTQEELLALDCDILVPAALEGAIDADVAERVSARLVAEAANGPCTPDADAVLGDRGVVVIPDVLASAGGVTVSYFEWHQNRTGERWSARRVTAELDARMRRAFDDLWAMAAERGLPLRTAASVLGVSRIAEAVEARAAGLRHTAVTAV
ncbi:MAG TPA: glutamate dehydrogenase, partial [Egibacteraceae bacterium]